MDTATPNIFINPSSSLGVETKSGKPRFNPKWVFIILGAVVAIEVIIGILTLMRGVPATAPVGQTATSTKGMIVLKTPQQEVKTGEVFSVTIEVVAPLPADGVDVLAKFDPKILEASDSAIAKGTIYALFPVATIDPSGLIKISGITPPGEQGFSGKGVLATVNFKAISSGKTSISLDFTKDSTADSNIVSGAAAKDLLEEVQNLEIIIK